MKFAIKTENLNAFLKKVRELVSEDTYVQENDFEDPFISKRHLFSVPSGILQVEVKGSDENINKVIKIIKAYC